MRKQFFWKEVKFSGKREKRDERKLETRKLKMVSEVDFKAIVC